VSAPPEPRKRRAWLAALLSLPLPGLGQLYNRQARLALALFAAGILLSGPGRWLIAAVPAAAVRTSAILVSCGIALLLFAVVHAAIRAWRAGAVPLAWFNRWFIYAGIFLLLTIWRGVVPLLPIASITSYSMPSGSMAPTLRVGDYFETRTHAFSDRLPERGELALFRTPSDPDVDFIHRIIGLPRDRIQMREGRLYLNGTLIERVPLSDTEAAPLVQFENSQLYRETLPGGTSYLIAEVSDNEGLDNTPEFVVPADHVFVLGDNRDRSNDSRAKRGFIPIAGLRDNPLFIFWSSDVSRIGKVLE